MKTKIIYKHPLKDEIYRQGFAICEFADKIFVSRWTLNNIFRHRYHTNQKEIIRLIASGLGKSYEETARLIRGEI